MANRVWGAGVGMDGLWSTATNWTGSVKPQAGDDVIFDGTDTTNCDIDENTANLGSLTATVAYTGTLDGATSDSDVTVAGDVTLDCTRVELGDGTWACNGHWDSDNVGTFVAGDSTIRMTGTTKNLNVNGGDINDITIDGGTITWTHAAIVSGTLTIINTASLTISAALNMHGIVVVSATGTNTITGGSNLQMISGSSITTKGGVIDVATLVFSGNHDANIVAGTYESALVEIKGVAGSVRTFKFAGGTFNFSGNVTFDASAAGDYIVDAVTNNPTINITGNCTMEETGAGAVTMSMGSGTWTVNGNIDFDPTTLNANTSALVLKGSSGSQTIDFNGNTLNTLRVDANGATKVIDASGFTAYSINLQNGTWDCVTNNPNINVTDNCDLNCQRVDMGSGTWTVGGGFENRYVGTWSADGGTVVMAVGGGTDLFNTTASNPLYNVSLQGNSRFNSGTMKIEGLLNITGGLLIDVATAISGASGDMQIQTGGSVGGNGMLTIEAPAKLSLLDEDIDCPVTFLDAKADGDIAAGTYGGAVVFDQSAASASMVFSSGIYNFSSTVLFDQTGAGNLTIDFNTNNPTVNIAGNCTLLSSGAASVYLNMGTGTWTVSGNWSSVPVTTISSTTATLVLDGTSKTFSTGADRLDVNVTFSGTISWIAGDWGLTNRVMSVSGTLTLPAGLRTIEWGGDLQITGTVDGAGLLAIDSSCSLSKQDGVISVAQLVINGVHNQASFPIDSGTYACGEVIFRNINPGPEVCEFNAGSYIFAGNVTFDVLGAGDYGLDCATNDTSFEFRGNVSISETGAGTLIWGKAVTGTVDFEGGGAIIFSDTSAAIQDLGLVAIDDAGTAVALGTAIRMTEFAGLNGTLDPNGQTITISGDCNFATSFDFASAADVMNGCTITVGGNWTGDAQTMVGTAGWTFTVGGTAVASGVGEVSYSDASGGTTIDATSGPWVDSLNNSNWKFSLGSAKSWVM